MSNDCVSMEQSNSCQSRRSQVFRAEGQRALICISHTVQRYLSSGCRGNRLSVQCLSLMVLGRRWALCAEPHPGAAEPGGGGSRSSRASL